MRTIAGAVGRSERRRRSRKADVAGKRTEKSAGNYRLAAVLRCICGGGGKVLPSTPYALRGRPENHLDVTIASALPIGRWTAMPWGRRNLT